MRMMKQKFQLARPCVLFCVILCTINRSSSLTLEERTVNAGVLGTIIGTEQYSTAPDNVEHIRFAGIPYANQTRFLPSTLREVPLNATGSFLASDYGPNCFQPSLGVVLQAEDCLFLNIWTRKVPKDGEEPVLRPVIVFVHGGAFTIGNGEFFPGNTIISRNVVYVSFNYRLGVLGFFSLNNEEAPGNAGMYDIVTALQWVKKYIHHFGGDPNKVTLAGQSAGGVAVSLMMISPLAEGLFHRAIVASGSILNQWGYTNNSRDGSLTIARACGCYDNDSVSDAQVIGCMKTTAAPLCLVRELLVYQQIERRAGRLGGDPISPTIQYFDIGTVPKLFLDDPNVLFTEGKQANIPLIIGSTRHDGSYVMGETYKGFLVPNNYFNNTDFMKTEMVPSILRALRIDDGSFGIYETLAKLYIGEARLSGDYDLMLPGLIDIHNVFYYKAAAHRTAILHSKVNNSTYLYSFDYKGSYSMWLFLFSLEPPAFPGGVTHTDDLIYLYPLGPAHNVEERNVSNRMLDYWFNFAESGNPTPSESNLTIWPTLETNGNQFLSINVDSHVLKNYPDAWVDASLELFPDLIPTTPTTAPEEPTEGEGSSTTEDIQTTTAGVDRVSFLPIILTIIFFISQML